MRSNDDLSYSRYRALLQDLRNLNQERERLVKLLEDATKNIDDIDIAIMEISNTVEEYEYKYS